MSVIPWSQSGGNNDPTLVSYVNIGSEQLGGDAHKMTLAEFHLCSSRGWVSKNVGLDNLKLLSDDRKTQNTNIGISSRESD